MKNQTTEKISYRVVKALNSRDVARLILNSDPWKKLRFKTKDAQAMAEMGRTKTPKTGSQRIVLGAYAGRKLIGFAIITSGFLGGWYLNNLVVADEARGQGVGAELMSLAEDAVFKTSKNFYLCVSSFNERALNFYEALGYEKIGTVKKLLVSKHDEILLRKSTGPLRR